MCCFSLSLLPSVSSVSIKFDIILRNIYHLPSLPLLKVNSTILKKKKLVACTTHIQFNDHFGNIYTQPDGMVMGSPSGPIFFMAHLENKIVNKLNKPTVYIRYIYDTFIQTKSIDDVIELRDNFEKHSPLKFSF